MLPVAEVICEAAPPSNTTRNTTEKLQPCNCRIKRGTAVATAQKSSKISLPSPIAVSTSDPFLLALRKHHHLEVFKNQLLKLLTRLKVTSSLKQFSF